MPSKLSHTPFDAESIKKKGKGILGVERGTLIKAFFGGNAFVAIIVLALITIFLFREGAGFFPQYRRDMELYRKSGQEFVALMKEEVDEFNDLQRKLDQVQVDIITRLYDEGKSWEEVTALTGPFQEFTKTTRAAVAPLEGVVKNGIKISVAAKEKVKVNETRRTIAGVNYAELMTEAEEEAYLREAELPVLEAFLVGLDDSDTAWLRFRWKTAAGRPFPMHVDVVVGGRRQRVEILPAGGADGDPDRQPARGPATAADGGVHRRDDARLRGPGPGRVRPTAALDPLATGPARWARGDAGVPRRDPRARLQARLVLSLECRAGP